MPDSDNDPIAPVASVANAPSVQPVHAERPTAAPDQRTPAPSNRESAAVVTGGSLPAAYAQFIVNADTHDVVIRIRDVATDRVIEEYPSQQVEELSKYMRAYAETLARHRAANRGQSNS